MHKTRALEQAHLDGMQPLLMLEIPPVLFLLCEVKMFALKRVYRGKQMPQEVSVFGFYEWVFQLNA